MSEPAYRQLLVDEVEARCRAIPDVAEVEVMPSGDPLSFRALHILDLGQSPGDDDSQGDRRILDLSIEGFVELGDGPAAHAALNALYADLIDALMPDPPLGGLAETIDEGAMQIVVATLADTRRMAFSLGFEIGFSTPRGTARAA